MRQYCERGTCLQSCKENILDYSVKHQSNKEIRSTSFLGVEMIFTLNQENYSKGNVLTSQSPLSGDSTKIPCEVYQKLLKFFCKSWPGIPSLTLQHKPENSYKFSCVWSQQTCSTCKWLLKKYTHHLVTKILISLFSSLIIIFLN